MQKKAFSYYFFIALSNNSNSNLNFNRITKTIECTLCLSPHVGLQPLLYAIINVPGLVTKGKTGHDSFIYKPVQNNALSAASCHS